MGFEKRNSPNLQLEGVSRRVLKPLLITQRPPIRYFAYGANVCPHVMHRRGVRFASRAPAVLRQHRLTFNKRAYKHALPETVGFAHIEADEGSAVEGMLYELVEGELERLDGHERAPYHYRRERMEVETSDGRRVDCHVYRAHPSRVVPGLIPSRNYLNSILAGRHWFSESYLTMLQTWPTFDGHCACCLSVTACELLTDQGLEFAVCLTCSDQKRQLESGLGRQGGVREVAERRSVREACRIRNSHSVEPK